LIQRLGNLPQFLHPLLDELPLPLKSDGQLGFVPSEQLTNFRHGKFQAPQERNHPSRLDFRGIVEAISGLFIDARRLQQPLFVIEAERLHRQAGDFREFADGEHSQVSLSQARGTSTCRENFQASRRGKVKSHSPRKVGPESSREPSELTITATEHST